MHYIIIGSSAAGISAISRIRSLDKFGEITLITQDIFEPYNICKIISYTASLTSNDKLSLISQTRLEDLVDNIFFNSQVKEIDIKNKNIIFEISANICSNNKNNKIQDKLFNNFKSDLSSGENSKILNKISYDKLLIATGSKYNFDNIFSKAKDIDKVKGLFSLYSRQDSEDIRSYLSENQVKEIVIIGAGLTGLETADAFASKGYNVTVIEKNSYILGSIFRNHTNFSGFSGFLNQDLGQNLPQDLYPSYNAKFIPKILEQLLNKKRDIKFYLSNTVIRYQENNSNRVELLKLSSGDIVKADLVIWAAGVRPNIDLAKASGLAVNDGILIDNNFRARLADDFGQNYKNNSENNLENNNLDNNLNIYAAGDCAEFDSIDLQDIVSIRNISVQNKGFNRTNTWASAIEQGGYAGVSMACEDKEDITKKYLGPKDLIISSLAGAWFATAGKIFLNNFENGLKVKLNAELEDNINLSDKINFDADLSIKLEQEIAEKLEIELLFYDPNNLDKLIGFAYLGSDLSKIGLLRKQIFAAK